MIKLKLKHLVPILVLPLVLTGCSSPEKNNQRQSFDNLNDTINISTLKSYKGQQLVLDKTKVQHLVFMNIWDTYEGNGAELEINELPELFKQQAQQIWVQPEINVTLAQLHEFQSYYPSFTPLILDKEFALMRALNVWDTPYHVLIQNGQTKFSGNTAQLRAHLNIASKPTNSRTQATPSPIKSGGNSVYNKLVTGNKAPNFQGLTLRGKQIDLATALSTLQQSESLNLVFLDALCPMPHFPNCEAKLLELKTSVTTEDKQNWLGIMSSFYIDKDMAKAFANKFELHFPIVFDLDNKIFEQMSVHSAPYLIQLDSAATVQYRGTELPNL